MAGARKDIVLRLSFKDDGTAVVKRVTTKVKKELAGTSKQAQAMTKAFKAMTSQVKRTTATQKQIAKTLSATAKALKKGTTETKKATTAQSTFKRVLKSTAVQMAAGMGLMMGVTGAIRGIKRAFSDTIKTGREFERTWANVTTMLTISEKETVNMKDALLRLSPTLGDTTELAKGMYQVLSASVEPAKAIEFLGVAAKSAVAGVTDTFTAVDALTTVVNAYGLAAEDATKVSDIMFMAVKRGKLTYEGLANSIGTVVPIAAQLDLSFEEIAAAMATLTRQGIDVRTTAVQLRQVMVSVLKPTKKAKDMAEALGIEFTATALKAKGLAGFLTGVKEKVGDNITNMTALFGNVRALTGIMGLAGTRASEFTDDLKRMEGASGSTEIAFKKQMASGDFWMKTFKNSIKKLQIAFYEGFIGPFREGITTSDALDRKISELITKVGEFGTKIGTFVKRASENISILVAGFGGLQASVDKTAEVFTDRIMKKFFPDVKSQAEVMTEAKSAAMKWAEGIKHVEVNMEDLEGAASGLFTKQFWKDPLAQYAGYQKVGFAVKEWREEVEALNEASRKRTAQQAIAKGEYAGIYGALVQNAAAMRENVNYIYATSESSEIASKRVRDYKKAMNDATKAIKEIIDPQADFNKLLKSLGVTLKTEVEKKLKTTADFLEKYGSKLPTGDVIKLTKEIKAMRIELGLQENIVATVIPKTIGLTDSVDKYRNIMAQANIHTNAAGGMFAYLSPFLIKAAEGIKKINENANILGVKTIPMMESELKESEKAFEELTKKGLLGPEAMVTAIEGLIQKHKEFTGEVPKDLKVMLKESKKSASILADDWQKSLSTVGMLFGVLGEQVGGTFGNLISTVGSGLQQAMALAEDGTKNFGEILGALAPVIGDIGGAIGSMISGTTKNFAKLGSSLGSTIGGMFGPVGKAIGGFAGGILGGLFKKKKTPEELAQEAAEKAAKDLEARVTAITGIMAKFGEISEGTAKKIIESTKGMEGYAAESKHFADVISDVGVKQSNINDLWARTQDILHHVTSGELDATAGAEALNDSFDLLLEGARKLGQEGSQAMIEFIRATRESGVEVAKVTEYVLDQLDRIPESLATLIKGKKGSLQGLGEMASQTFNAMIANGRSYMDSLKAMKSPLTALFDEYKKRGEELPSYLEGMADLMEKMELSPQVFENLDAATNVLSALKNSAYLTQGAFNELSLSAAAFARTILDVKGNLNEALGSMTLTERQIQQLLPIVAQFVGAAALFGLGVPAWMKTFVTKHLGMDFKKFEETVKAQAGAGIATVDALNKLMDNAIPDQTKDLRDGAWKDTDKIWKKIDHMRRDIYGILGGVIDAVEGGTGKTGENGRNGGGNGEDIIAQKGFHGTVPKPTRILVHPKEIIDITPMNKMSDGGGGGTVIFSPSFNLLDASDVEQLMENKLYPEFLRLIDSDKGEARGDLRKAARIE